MTDQHVEQQAHQTDVVNPYDRPAGNQFEPPRKNRWVPACLIGCGVVALVVVLACGIGGYWTVTKAPAMAARAVRDGMAEQVRSSDLPEAEQEAIVQEMDRVVVAIEKGDVNMQNVKRTMEELAESPLVIFVLIAGLEEQYLKKSGLSNEEKAAAKLTIQRIYRGVKEEKIDMSQLESGLEHIATKKADGGWELKSHVSDEDLRAFLAECKQLADDAEVPNEPFEFVLSEEVHKIVDSLLGAPAAAEAGSAEESSPRQPAEIEESEQVPTF